MLNSAMPARLPLLDGCDLTDTVSGLISPKAINLIGNGTVVHVPQFFKELHNLQSKGIDANDRIFISDRAHVLFELRKSA